MLKTRLWMGAVLVILAAGVLVVDQRLMPWSPFLFFLVVILSSTACFEILHLVPAEKRPSAGLCYLAVIFLTVANWVPHVCSPPLLPATPTDPWHWIVGVFAAVVLAAFLMEMARFTAQEQSPGTATARIAMTIWIAAYLGLLPSFLAQLRWPAGVAGAADFARGTVGLALAIFVPKCCDIGAYFTGRALGRHPMAPVLSPKKTWEGAGGGIATAAAATIGINRLCSPAVHVLPGFWAELGFGVTVGLAGMLGDLAESLIKRDCREKDASRAVPGFGGVLDVVDAVLFAAPVAYCWLRF